MGYGLVATTFTTSQQLPDLAATKFDFKPTTPCCDGAIHVFNKVMSDNTSASILTICYCLQFVKSTF